LNKDTIIYFWFQMIILLVTIFIFVYSTVKRHKLNTGEPRKSSITEKTPEDREPAVSELSDGEIENLEAIETKAKSEDALYFFLICFIHFFLPIMDIYPSVYVWYDYETNSSLAFTPRSFKFTFLLLGFVMVKLMFFIWNSLVLNQVIADPEFISRNRLIYRLSCRGVSGGVLPYLCIDGIQSVLIYFYFTRFILPGEIISDGAYLCLALAVLKDGYHKLSRSHDMTHIIVRRTLVLWYLIKHVHSILNLLLGIVNKFLKICKFHKISALIDKVNWFFSAKCKTCTIILKAFLVSWCISTSKISRSRWHQESRRYRWTVHSNRDVFQSLFYQGHLNSHCYNSIRFYPCYRILSWTLRASRTFSSI